MNAETKPSNSNNPFNGYISQIDAISIDELVGETRLGPTLSFQGSRQTFESIKEFIDEIRSLDSLWVPGRMIGRADAAFQEITNLLQQMNTFTINNHLGNQALRGNLTQQLGNKFEELVEATIPILWFSNYRSSGIKDTQLKTAALLKDIEEQKTEISGVVGESRELLAKQKKLSADITITAYGILFKN